MAIPVVRGGAVLPTAEATVRLRPLALGGSSITGGFWADRLRMNRERTIRTGSSSSTGPGT